MGFFRAVPSAPGLLRGLLWGAGVLWIASACSGSAQKAANAATKAASAKTPEESVQSQTKYAQEAFDANVQNMQAAAKSASEAAVKIFDIINKQTVEYISEVSKAAQAG